MSEEQPAKVVKKKRPLAQIIADRKAEREAAAAEKQRKKAKTANRNQLRQRRDGKVRFPKGHFTCVVDTCKKEFDKPNSSYVKPINLGMCPECQKVAKGVQLSAVTKIRAADRAAMRAQQEEVDRLAAEAEHRRVAQDIKRAADAAAEQLRQEMASAVDDPLVLQSALSRLTQSVVTVDEVVRIQMLHAQMRMPTDGLTTQQLVDRELAMRELARRKLIWFTLRRRPSYMPGWFAIDLAERLERFVYAVKRGESPRLIIAAPPRHGKSALSSEDMPAFAQGLMNDIQIIAASYNDDLAMDFSKVVQQTMASEDYKVLFDGLTVSDWSKAVDSWANSKGGLYRATGVGGSLTGRGAHILLIEDPFKNRQDADSATKRKTVWDWFTSTAYTRLMPGGGVIVIATRWHGDDLTGRLLAQLRAAELEYAKTGVWPEDADRWEVVSYPAVAIEDEVHRKAGEALHPERYPLKNLLQIRRTLVLEGDPRDWAALYQQSPVPEEGAFFTKDHIHFYDKELPPGINLIGGDLAVSKEQHADNSVYLIGRLDAEDNLYIFDGIRKKMDTAEIVDTLFALYKEHKPLDIGIGKDVIEKSIGPFLDQRIREEKLYSMVVTPMPHNNHDKMARARPIQGRMKQRKVFFKRGAPFLEWLLPEWLGFPNARKDDSVDAGAILGQMLNNHQYRPPVAKQPKSWRDKLQNMGNRDSTTPNASMGA